MKMSFFRCLDQDISFGQWIIFRQYKTKHSEYSGSPLPQDLSQRVDESMNDAQRSDDEGVVTEEFSESRGSSDTKEEVEEAECPVIRCPDAACLASKKFETILKVSSSCLKARNNLQNV